MLPDCGKHNEEMDLWKIGEVFVPLFERLERELETLQKQETALDRIRARCAITYSNATNPVG